MSVVLCNDNVFLVIRDFGLTVAWEVVRRPVDQRPVSLRIAAFIEKTIELKI
jgi:hypothetical protein